MTSKNRINIKIIMPLVILVCLTCVLFVLYNRNEFIYSKLNDLKLIPRPETFTELYLEDHQTLPKNIKIGETINFSFTINNLEGKDMEYPYQVYYKSADSQVLYIDQQTRSVKYGEHITINESYVFNEASTTGAVYIELTQKNQEVHFLLAIE